MTVADTAAAAPSLSVSDLGRRIVSSMRHGDILLALGVVTILVVLILPLPRWLLDISLAFSITFSVLILLTGLFVERPLEFNAFPTILLLSTMVRLALNMASTRLILTHGHEGTDAAGRIIEAFAGFIMGGNFVIGVIVFAILLIVNFVVITKGSTRIAEVSARFTLDAMPGKQMAVDADLSSGLINEDTARKRRQELEEESSFFGAMDGASKFVRGDAIAGLLITFINIIAGIIIGVAQNGMSFEKAADTFVRLTVGDGLVTQIPALIVATAAGIVVTKAGLSTKTEKALFGQLGGQPKAMAIATVLLVGLALLPNVPALPFLLLATRPEHWPGSPSNAARRARPKRRRQRHNRRRRSKNRSRLFSRSTRFAWKSAMACWVLSATEAKGRSSRIRSRRCADSSPPNSASWCRASASRTTCSWRRRPTPSTSRT